MTLRTKPKNMSEESWEIIQLSGRALSIAINRLSLVEFMALIDAALNTLAITKGLSREEMQIVMEKLISAQEEVWKKYGYPKTREEAN